MRVDYRCSIFNYCAYIYQLQFFIEKPADLLDYDKIVKKPMYFAKIEKNAENGKYETEGKMKEDLDLIFKNSQKYNKVNFSSSI